jgi:hypothetical protein
VTALVVLASQAARGTFGLIAVVVDDGIPEIEGNRLYHVSLLGQSIHSGVKSARP